MDTTGLVFLSSRNLIVDTSALIAVLFREEDWRNFHQQLENTYELAMSAASYLELFIVVRRKLGPVTSSDVDDDLSEIRIEIVPFDQVQAELARLAFERFGRGRHPAGLNFGDCDLPPEISTS